jgi:hypothetical protein
MVKKIKPKKLFTETEIKAAVVATTVDNNKTVHDETAIVIDERPVVCKKCDMEFSTADVKCYECFQYQDRVAVYCPNCTTLNKIKKVLTINRSKR